VGVLLVLPGHMGHAHDPLHDDAADCVPHAGVAVPESTSCCQTQDANGEKSLESYAPLAGKDAVAQCLEDVPWSEPSYTGVAIMPADSVVLLRLSVQYASAAHLHDHVVACPSGADVILPQARADYLLHVVPLVLVHLCKGEECIGVVLEEGHAHLWNRKMLSSGSHTHTG